MDLSSISFSTRSRDKHNNLSIACMITSSFWNHRTDHPCYNSRRIAENSRYSKLQGQSCHLPTFLGLTLALVMSEESVFQARKPCIEFPGTLFTQESLPILHEHVLHTCHMQIVFLAWRSIAPAPAFTSTFLTRCTHLPVQIQLNLAVVKNHRQLCAAGMEIKPTVSAMVEETRDIPFARVTEARPVIRRSGEELEGTFGVERVGDRGRRDGTVHMEIEITNAAFVTRSDPYFLAAITLEWKFWALKSQLVLRVAKVSYLTIFHGFVFAASNNLQKQVLYRDKNHGFLIERLLGFIYLYRDSAN